MKSPNTAMTEIVEPRLASATDLEELNKSATPGKWGQFHPNFMPEAKGAPLGMLDNSHQSSAVYVDGNGAFQRYRLGEWRHADDAAFAEALINLYRAGKLVVIE